MRTFTAALLMTYASLASANNEIVSNSQFKDLGEQCFSYSDYKKPQEVCQTVGAAVQRLANENAVFKVTCEYSTASICQNIIQGGYILKVKFMPIDSCTN